MDLDRNSIFEVIPNTKPDELILHAPTPYKAEKLNKIAAVAGQ